MKIIECKDCKGEGSFFNDHQSICGRCKGSGEEAEMQHDLVRYEVELWMEHGDDLIRWYTARGLEDLTAQIRADVDTDDNKMCYIGYRNGTHKITEEDDES